MATEQSSFCVNCGVALVAGARFCGKCGQTLASAAPAAPAAPPAQATAPLPAQTPAAPPQYAAPQQYAPQQPLPAYGMPPPVARSGGSGVGVIVAVVVVGLVLILGVGGALAWYFLSARNPQGPPVAGAQLPAPALAGTPVALPPQPVAARAQIPPGPGEAAVLAESKARKPGWDAAVHSHTGDWVEVVTKVGPSWGDWRTGLRFRWNGSRYEWVAEGPVAQIANPGTPAATGGGKGAGAALATAKARFGGYVAKVYNQSGNYQNVLVWVGPPNSEWTHYVHMVWNGSRYVIDDTGILEQSGVAADEGWEPDYVQPEDWVEYPDNGGDSEQWGYDTEPNGDPEVSGGDVEPNGGEDSGGPWEGNPDENPGAWEGDPSEDPYAVG